MDKDKFLQKDVIKTLKTLGLKLDDKTGGQFIEDYSHKPLLKNKVGMFVLESPDNKITFLNGTLFINTVKMVEDNLNYKLFA